MYVNLNENSIIVGRFYFYLIDELHGVFIILFIWKNNLGNLLFQMSFSGFEPLPVALLTLKAGLRFESIDKSSNTVGFLS